MIAKNLNYKMSETNIAGFYNVEGNLVSTYEESGVDVTKNYTAINYSTSTTSMYYYLERNKNVVKVILPDNVTKIGQHTFRYCRSLTSITIPESVTSIGTDAFYDVNHIYYNATATGSPWGLKQ